jgi:adenosylcobinamide-phosphate synthase
MFFFGFANTEHGFDPLALLLVALLLDGYLGEAKLPLRLFRHPVEIIGALIDWFDRKLNRENRTAVDRAFRGALVVIIVAGLSGTVGWGSSWLTQHHDFGWVLELFILTAMLAGRGLYDSVRAVGIGLEESLEKGRQAVSHIVGRAPKHLDKHGVSRAAIESCAENFSDGLVAPVFWYVLFGLPGLMVYKAVNTMDSMIGHMTPKYQAFGMTAARVDDVLNLIPARLSGLFLVLAATFTPGAHPFKALKIMLRDSGKHRSMNAGWPEGAAAGALDIALAGPRRYQESITDDPWLGDGTARAGVKDIRRMLYLYVTAALINGAWVAALAIVRMSW